MGRLLALIFIVATSLVGCAPKSSIVHYQRVEDDPMYQEIKTLVDAKQNCFMREARSKSVESVDINTAALAIFGRCAPERARYKAWAGSHTIENPIQFNARWTGEEADDLLFIKQALAMIRTGSQ